MSFSSWLRFWKLALARGSSSERRSRRKHRSSYRPRLGLERLEDRTVLSITDLAGMAIHPQEGMLFNGTVATFRSTDNGPYTASITWGDGHTSPGSVVAGGGGNFSIQGSNTYADNGSYKLTFSVTDTSTGQTVMANSWNTSSNPWSTATLPNATYGSSAAAGPDGKLYVFGGNNNSGSLNAVQVYDPSSHSWSTTSIPISAFGTSAAAGPDGKLYVFVGNNGGYLNTVQVYDPSSHSWSTTSMPTATQFSSAAAGPDGKLYVFGGNNALNTVQVYDLSIFAWPPPLPTATEHSSAVAGPDGKLYVFGGYNGSYLNMVQVYDPTSHSWSTTTNMPNAAYGSSAAIGPDGKLYVFGGSNGSYYNTVQVYDPTSRSWSTMSNVPIATFGSSAAAGPDGKLYVFGGTNGSISNTVQVYDPTSHSWSTTFMPIGTVFSSAVAGLDGKLYVFGGVSSGYSNTVQVYDPTSHSWSITNMPNATSYSSAAAGPDGKLYVFGGYNNGSFLNTVQVYDPSSHSWSTSTMPTATYGSSAAVDSNGQIYVFGGYNASSGYLNSVQVYTPSSLAEAAEVPPTAAIISPPPSDARVGSPITVTGSASDPSSADLAAGFTYDWSVTKAGQNTPFYTQTGHDLTSITFTPDASGTYTVSLIVTDKDNARSTPATQDITVAPANTAPTASNSSVTTDEDTPASGFLSATDADDDSLTYSIVSGPAHGQMVLNTNGGSYSYTPDLNFNGSDSFTFKANDGQADNNFATVNLTITPVNDAPSFTVGPDIVVNEDAGPQSVGVQAGSRIYWINNTLRAIQSSALDGSDVQTLVTFPDGQPGASASPERRCPLPLTVSTRHMATRRTYPRCWALASTPASTTRRSRSATRATVPQRPQPSGTTTLPPSSQMAVASSPIMWLT